MTDELIVLVEFEAASGLTRREIAELVDYGVFEPEGSRENDWLFPASALTLARAAARLRAEFDLSAENLALLLAYRERLQELERRIRELECRLPR